MSDHDRICAKLDKLQTPETSTYVPLLVLLIVIGMS